MARKQQSGSRRGAKKSRSGIPASDDVVFVGGIPREATQSDLKALFQQCVGGVKKVRFVIDQSTRHHKGFGFARFNDAEHARKACILGKAGIYTHGKMLNIGGSFENEDESSGTCGLSSSNSDGMSLTEEVDEIPELLEEDVAPQVQMQQVQQTYIQQVPVQQVQYAQYQPMQQVQQMQQMQRPVYVMQQMPVQQMPMMNYVMTPQGVMYQQAAQC